MKKLDFAVTPKNFENDVKRLYTILRPDIRPDEIECDGFGEGCLNSLVKLDDPKNRDPIVVRVYLLKLLASMSEEERELEKSRPSLVNRELELEALQKASELGITVRLYATFQNGFIYRYVDADMNSFELYDFEVARKTAMKLAKLHRIDLSGLAREKPAVYRILGRDDPKCELEQRAFFDRKMRESELEQLRTSLPSYSKLSQEFERLHDLIFEKDAYGPICFAHNDLNLGKNFIGRSPYLTDLQPNCFLLIAGNLLIEKHSKEPILIDFEWVSTE